MGYLKLLKEYREWQVVDFKNRNLYQIVCAQEMKPHWRVTSQTKTNIKMGCLSEDDFEMLCEYAYNLYIGNDTPVDMAILAATLKYLLETKKITLADIKANKAETEDLVLEQAVGTED